MSKTRKIVLVQSLLLFAFTSPFSNAMAVESDKAFAKCSKTLAKYANKHLAFGKKARRAHDQKIDKLIAKTASRNPDPASEVERLIGIIDRLVARYDLDDYQKRAINDIADAALNTENDENFFCPSNNSIANNFKNAKSQFEFALDEIEKITRGRLDIENLGSDEGLVVISFYAYGRADSVRINRLGALGGGIEFGPIYGNEYFRVVKAKAGKYEWDTIVDSWWLKVLIKRADLEFSVEAGKLNYTGLFVYPPTWIRDRHLDVYDRTAVTLTLLEQRYPELLDQYEVNNGLYPDNRFIEFYMREKAAAEKVGE